MRPLTPARAALLLALAAPLGGCDQPTAPDGSAPFAGRLDGRAFGASADAALVRGGAGRDTLYVHSGAVGGLGEYPVSITLTLAGFAGAGRYPLRRDHARVFETVGGDALHSVYVSAGPSAGAVVVTAYDPTSGTVTGTVEFSAARAPGHAGGSFGSSVRLSHGRFRAAARAVR
jgi:hypothetical protein